MKPLAFTAGSYQGPMLMYYCGAVSLKAEYEQAVRWLQDEFPEKKGEIEWKLGTRVAPMQQSASHPPEYVPASQLIREFALG